MKQIIQILKFLYQEEQSYTKSQLRKELNLNISLKTFDRYINILEEHKLIICERKKYHYNFRVDIVFGQYTKIKNKFVVIGNTISGQKQKLEIQDIYKDGVLYKDKVIAIKLSGDLGKIVLPIEHNLGTIIGTYIQNNNSGYVIPDDENINKDILIQFKNNKNAFSYDRVEVEVFTDIMSKKPEGKIKKILNYSDETNKLTLEDILEINHISKKYPTKAINSIQNLSSVINAESLKNRTDFTKELIVTIDGEDAKDLDDAISIKKTDHNTYILGVHIADVSHYIQENTALDNEALKRGCSIYLIDTVIPMLPKKISNEICSLNPNVVRLTLSCVMEIDSLGKVINSDIKESFISSKAQLNYTEVNNYLQKEDKDINGISKFETKYPDISKMILVMLELKEILNKKRLDRGSIEFDFPETKIIFNNEKDKLPISIDKYPRGVANDIIEEFMLICNETIAETYFKKDVPFIYRVHKSPSDEKINKFVSYLKEYGIDVSADELNGNPKLLQKILNDVKDTNLEFPIELMALHTMMQAKYQTDCNLHFGLAAYYYCHFTSPIRRYPDLIVHRIIKNDIHNTLNYHHYKTDIDILDYIAKQCSKRERISEQVEEEYDNLKKAEYMELHQDDIFDGIITSISMQKIEVTLQNTITGNLVINKKYKFDNQKLTYINNQTKDVYNLGKKITLEIDKIDFSTNSIYFKEFKEETSE